VAVSFQAVAAAAVLSVCMATIRGEHRLVAYARFAIGCLVQLYYEQILSRGRDAMLHFCKLAVHVSLAQSAPGQEQVAFALPVCI
jgi:hypothetical protein